MAVENPFFTSGRVSPEKFIGRKRELREIAELLRTEHSVELLGPSQIGKSSLLAYLVAHGEELLGEPTTFVSVDFQAIRDEEALWADVPRQLKVEKSDPRESLMAAARKRRVVLCLDELEKGEDPFKFSEDLWGQLRSYAQKKGICLILASRRPLAEILPQGKTSPLVNVLSRVKLGALDDKESRQLLETYLEPTKVVFPDEEIDGILRRSEGHPAKIQELARELFKEITGNTDDTELRAARAFTSDKPRAEDLLWDDVYARALHDFLTHEDTHPPLVVGIDAPWGGGKSSLMRALQSRLEEDRDKPSPKKPRVTLGRLQELLKDPDSGEAPSVPADDGPVTVWFNAWKYSRDEQLWAALVRTVIRQVGDRMPPLDREKFLLRLNLRRVDREKVRRRIQGVVLGRLFPWLVVQLVALVLVLGEFALFGSQATIWFSAVPFVGIFWSWWKAKRAPLSIDLDLAKYVQEPKYDEKIGFLGEVERDFLRVQKTLGKDRRLVIFVDDLDRCSPGKITELIEAVNIFFGLEDCRCFFVLGIDGEYVRAGIESAYASLKDALDEERREKFGAEFLDKIVQVWLKLPEPDEREMRNYLEKVLDGRDVTQTVDADEVEEAREELLERKTGFRELEETAEDVAEEHPEFEDEVIGEAARDAAVDLLTEEDPEVRKILLEGARALGHNPRKVKLFINRFRLEAMIRIRRRETLGFEAFRNLALEVAETLRGKNGKASDAAPGS